MTEATIPPDRGGPYVGEGDWSVIGRALRAQVRVLGALFLRESLMRRGRALPLGWTSWIEPFVVILEVSIFFSLIERNPPYGDSLLLFVGTGVFPVYVFLQTSRRMRVSLMGSWTLRLPIETPLDVVIVHGVLQFLGDAAVAAAYFGVLYMFGVKSAMPADLGAAMEAFSAIFMLGVAMGMFNALIGNMFPVWDLLWPPISRASLHFSGLYFVADFLTPNVRKYFAYNPLIHGVNWFRHAFYPFYPTVLDNHVFPLATAAVAIVLSLCLQRVLDKQYFHAGNAK